MLIALLLAAASAVPELPKDIPPTAIMYEVRLVGSPAGQLAVWPDGQGIRAFFQYNDRGRGPKTSTTTTLGTDGTPQSLLIEGTNYMTAPVSESFSLKYGAATWKSNSEQGTKSVTAPAFYVSTSGSPLEMALLADAALRNGGKIALLPEGEAQVTTVVTHGAATLYAVTGLDFTPSYVWLDGDRHLFAISDPWLSVVREGEQAQLPDLAAAQKAALAERSKEQAARLVHRPAGKLVIHDASVFDAERAEIQRHMDVIVEGNHIVSVQATGPAPKDAEVIEAAGKTLLPGLWDMHAHVAPTDGLLNLMSGVTTVRDLANDSDDLSARMERIEKGEEIGTRILRGGIIEGNGPNHGPTEALVSNLEEANKWVNWYADQGYQQIKLYSSFNPEWIAPVAEQAHRRGLRVSGHVPSGTFAEECVLNGYDELQHVNFLALNFFRDVTSTTGTERFVALADRAANLDLASQKVKKFIALLRERHTAIDPTLGVFERIILGKPGQLPAGFETIAPRLPPQVRRFLLSSEISLPPGNAERRLASWKKMLKLVYELWKAGVYVEIGTDNIAGYSLHRELELEVQVGIPAPQVLQLATLGAARIMGMSRQLGSVLPSKLADLTLIDGDPLRDISLVRKVVLTIKDGAVYRPAELERELGITPR